MRALILMLAGTVLVFGQGVRSGSNRHGYGNVVFPGTGGPPGRHAPVTHSSTFAGRVGAAISGYPAYTGGTGYRGPARPVLVVPWAYPVYPAYYTDPQPSVVVVPQAQTPVASSPQVVINQHFTPEVARPVVREYASDDGVRIYEVPRRQAPASSSSEESAAASPAEEKRPYLLALKDSSVYVAFTFWREGETLHYVTMQGVHNQVSLDRLDRDMTMRLNRERSVELKLP